MRNFYHSYYRLFILSFAVQHALEVDEAHIELPRYCAASFQAAADIMINLRDYLRPRGYFRYATDSSFVFVSYACCFLLKLVSPAFSAYVDTDKALELVTQGADALELVAVDASRTPALYASFIRALLEIKLNRRRSGPGSRVPTRPTSPVLGPLDNLPSDWKGISVACLARTPTSQESQTPMVPWIRC